MGQFRYVFMGQKGKIKHKPGKWGRKPPKGYFQSITNPYHFSHKSSYYWMI